ncbi:MAG: sialate O-acetylesterase [Planctomycetes bacterium]|nr:sialate O-acetylesterase [Planctomycetota bacterium]
MKPRRAGLFLAVLLLAATARADPWVPSTYGDSMVLQRDRPVRVTGGAEPGERVSVRIAGKSGSAVAGPDGSFSVELPALRAGGPHEMVVKGHGPALVFHGVLVGEVWVCSGQSNMAWTVAASKGAAEEVPKADHPMIRFLTVPPKAAVEPARNFPGRWLACTPESVRGFSAVGYFFGREIHRALKVPVGLVNASFGGTPAEAWTPRAELAADGSFEALLGRFPESPGADGKPVVRADRPGQLYDAMIAPLAGFPIRGVIWYQGESNAGRASQYRRLFPCLIRSWRKAWGQGDFPFHFVQLANFRARAAEPGPSEWAELREAQRATLEALPATGMAVTIDIGDAGDIHPKNKQEVGRRLALLALAKDYGKDVIASGPVFVTAERRGDGMALRFAEVAGGLRPSGDGKLTGFAVAGLDRQFRWAEAVVTGKDSVLVRCPAVPEPVAVRYAWADNPEANLVNGAVLPASPFRTDDWPGVTEGKE